MTKLALVELELIEPPEDAKHRFSPIFYRGQVWDMSHLDSFAFRCEVLPKVKVDVVVLFSCHCFTHKIKDDPRPESLIPASELFIDDRERRVLDEERYKQSCMLLKNMVQELPKRKIIVADERLGNFMTWKIHSPSGEEQTYAVFFEVTRDRSRQRRVVLRIQSAYVLDDGLNKRQSEAKKVTWGKLIKAAYEGTKIRP